MSYWTAVFHVERWELLAGLLSGFITGYGFGAWLQ